MKPLLARAAALAGTALALWGCVEVIAVPERSEPGSWTVFLGLLIVLMAACWAYRLREDPDAHRGHRD